MPEKKDKWYILDRKSISTLLVVLISILFYVGLTHFDVVRARAAGFLSVLSPFIGGFIIAYLLNTPMCFFERKVFQQFKHRWGLSILTVYLLTLAVLAVLLNMVLPQVVQSILDLAGNLEGYVTSLNALLNDLTQRYHLEGMGLEGLEEIIGSLQDLVKNVLGMLAQSLPRLLDFGMALGSGVITAVTALISSIYMLGGKSRLVPQLKKLLCAVFPRRQAERSLQILAHANEVFVGFINGKLIDSAIIGVLCFVLCLICRVPYPTLVGVVVGVTNVIPFFGPIIGAVPCLMILVIVDPLAALRFLILVVALQQFDGNVLGPKILGDSTGLSAIWVLVAIVVGGGLFGFPGMVLGVPTFAVIYELVRQWVNKRLAAKEGAESADGADEASNRADAESSGPDTPSGQHTFD